MNHEQLYKAPVGFSADQQCLIGMLWRMAGAEDERYQCGVVRTQLHHRAAHAGRFGQPNEFLRHPEPRWSEYRITTRNRSRCIPHIIEHEMS